MPFEGFADENPNFHRQRPLRQRGLTEDDILDRLEQLQAAIELPAQVWNLLVEILCPDTQEIPPLPPEPTQALPGTVEKIAVMAQRAAEGYHLYHPDDITWDHQEADRLSITAIVRRNGIPERMTMEALEKQGAEGRLATLPVSEIQEGFRLPGEGVLVGRIPPAQRMRKPRKNLCSPVAQLTLWAD